MCLTCGCLEAHLEMGDNVTYEDLKRMADGNDKSLAETLEIIRRTVDIERADHAMNTRRRTRNRSRSPSSAGRRWSNRGRGLRG